MSRHSTTTHARSGHAPPWWAVGLGALLSMHPGACVGAAAVILGPCVGASDKEDKAHAERLIRMLEQIEKGKERCGDCRPPTACNVLATPPACQAPIGANERCAHPDDEGPRHWELPCKPPLRCSTEGVCRPPRARGEPCFSDEDCSKGLTCQNYHNSVGACLGP